MQRKQLVAASGWVARLRPGTVRLLPAPAAGLGAASSGAHVRPAPAAPGRPPRAARTPGKPGAPAGWLTAALPLRPRPALLQDQEAQVVRKKRRATGKVATRSIVNASLEIIQKKKAEKPEQRKASREAALR